MSKEDTGGPDVLQQPEYLAASGTGDEDIASADFHPVEASAKARVEWVEDKVEIEPGIGVACAKANHYADELFAKAQDRLKVDINMFLLGKNDQDVVLKKECGLLLASRLSDIETNSKIQDAYTLGVPIVLAEDVCRYVNGGSLTAYLSPDRLQEYKRSQSAFEENWDLVPYRLQGNDKYFLTHSDAGYKLLSSLEGYLREVIGPKQDVKSQSIPKGKPLDFVVVPTLRTTSAKFISVLAREMPVLAIRSSDLEGREIGDDVPAWRWKGGEFFLYPPLRRERDRATQARLARLI
jgi:hypothetical protein